jgi:hypothetical protein
VRSYHTFIEHATQSCNENDVTPVALEKGLEYANEIMAAVKTRRELFKV